MKPVIRWNSVVLPAPLGPISAVTEPRRTSSVAPCTARIPPNRLSTPLTTRMRSTSSPSAFAAAAGASAAPARATSLTQHHLLALAEDALRAERHEQDEREAHDDEPQGRDLVAREREVDRARRLEQELDDHRAHDHAREAGQAAQDQHRVPDEREGRHELGGVEEREVERQQPARERPEHR